MQTSSLFGVKAQGPVRAPRVQARKAFVVRATAYADELVQTAVSASLRRQGLLFWLLLLFLNGVACTLNCIDWFMSILLFGHQAFGWCKCFALALKLCVLCSKK